MVGCAARVNGRFWTQDEHDSLIFHGGGFAKSSRLLRNPQGQLRNAYPEAPVRILGLCSTRFLNLPVGNGDRSMTLGLGTGVLATTQIKVIRTYPR